MLRQMPIVMLFTLVISACGSNNLNGYLESKARKNSVDALLQEAQYEFDKKNYKAALSKARKARKILPDNEHATVLLSYIHLGMAGLDTISLAKGLSSDDDEADQDQDKTARTFAKLAKVMGLGEDDLIELSREATDDDGPLVYIPKTTSQARKSASNVMKNLNSAVRFLCPFVSDEAKLLADDGDALYDPRHEACDTLDSDGQARAQAHFAWALAHLGEAITFYSLIFHRSPDYNEPNIVERSKLVGGYKDDLPTYIVKITELAELVDAVFPTSESESSNAMLNAMFNNLETTGFAFGAIAGLPEAFTKSVQEAIDNLRSKIGNISEATSADNNEALKNSLTTGLSKELSKQIEEIEVENEDDLNKICCSYWRINSSSELPSKCPSKDNLKNNICPSL